MTKMRKMGIYGKSGKMVEMNGGAHVAKIR